MKRTQASGAFTPAQDSLRLGPEEDEPPRERLVLVERANRLLRRPRRRVLHREKLEPPCRTLHEQARLVPRGAPPEEDRHLETARVGEVPAGGRGGHRRRGEDRGRERRGHGEPRRVSSRQDAPRPYRR